MTMVTIENSPSLKFIVKAKNVHFVYAGFTSSDFVESYGSKNGGSLGFDKQADEPFMRLLMNLTPNEGKYGNSVSISFLEDGTAFIDASPYIGKMPEKLTESCSGILGFKGDWEQVYEKMNLLSDRIAQQ